MSLTTDMMHELFEYKDGKLFWRVSRGSAKAGTEAGCVGPDGYHVTRVNRKNYKTHRLIYMLMVGHIPNRLQIDHIDGNRLNNKLENLRVVTAQDNSRNRRKSKGYFLCKKTQKYKAYIDVDNGDKKHLGYFTTEDEAREAYLEAKKKHHPLTPNDYFAKGD